MKTILTTIALLCCTLLLTAQTYTLELPVTPSHEWNTNQWSGEEEEGLSFIATEKNFFGVSRETVVNIPDESAFTVTRKGTKYVLEDEAGETRLVRLPSNYVMGDGIRLERQLRNWNKKICITHPDGRLLAEGIAENNVFSKYNLKIRIHEASDYNAEILAMLSIDLIALLRMKSMGMIIY